MSNARNNLSDPARLLTNPQRHELTDALDWAITLLPRRTVGNVSEPFPIADLRVQVVKFPGGGTRCHVVADLALGARTYSATSLVSGVTVEAAVAALQMAASIASA